MAQHVQQNHVASSEYRCVYILTPTGKAQGRSAWENLRRARCILAHEENSPFFINTEYHPSEDCTTRLNFEHGQMGKAKSNKDRRFHIGTASNGCLILHTKPEKATRIEADAYGPVFGILCWNTLVTVMPGLGTKINAMSIMAVFHNNSCHAPTPIRTAKASFTRSAPVRMVICETLTDVPLKASQKPTGLTAHGIPIRSEWFACLFAPAPWSNLDAHYVIDQDLGRVLQKDCPSDVSLGERNPNLCSPSSNGTLTLTGAPLPGTRAAAHWQRQRSTRNRRRLASNSCTGSCGKAGSPHTIMLRSSMVLEVFSTHHPRIPD